ncbi:aspartic proteinase-like protein 1 isoform X1 [Vigna radiata var. radiata]|uniref:Aspartic proteinase-like protein 1 isoform X1 n=1 Tax=Vigna radiata var. radiata TaxID=3916 RepID=A0A1S3TKR9_VIGRR|nr:aspartic proteinase-like protein 1 isoform X1 [Vigna radiata var. radiata]
MCQISISMRWRLLLLLLLELTARGMPLPITFSARLVHRFADEIKPVRIPTGDWPDRKSLRYYHMLLADDILRRKIKLGGARYQLLFPTHGSKTLSLGNDFGWLHYTWIDVGTPSTSFLVALDAGSDLLWIPCDCVQCAPLSSSYYSNLDRDLNEYSPSRSLSSKHLSCSNHWCDNGSNCKSSQQQCPYMVSYLSDNTSSSGLLVEDILHLQSGSGLSNSSVQAPVVLGCGMKQSGGYLDGVAPDGLLGLGPGESSVPSFLANSGLIHNSFSLCFNEDDSGRMFFGDQGPTIQQSTPFLPLDGLYSTYIVGVDSSCIGNTCLKMTSFKAQIDSGTSFTFLPGHAYGVIAEEFDQQVNGSRSSFEGSPWEYCYVSSSKELPKVPSLTLVFQQNNSFVVYNPVFVFYGNEGVVGFCLAIQPTEGDMGTIGQNFMTGYRLVFDRENKKLAWSRSNCQDLSVGKRMPLSPNETSPNPLPSDEQQRTNGHAVAPAVAGRAPHKSSAALSRMNSSFRVYWHCYFFLLFQLVSASY